MRRFVTPAPSVAPQLLFVVCALALLVCAACGRIAYDPVESHAFDGSTRDAGKRDGSASDAWIDGGVLDGGSGHLRITIAAGTVGEDLIDFPLLVTVVAADLARAGAALTAEPRFLSPEHPDPLDHDLRAPASSGKLVAWVLVPRIHRDATTTIDLFTDSAESRPSDPRAVWRSYAAVWHLDDPPDRPIADATGNGGEGVSLGAMDGTSVVDGIGHRALEFDGVDDGLTVDGGPAITTTDPMTISLWVRNRAFGLEGPPLFARAVGFASTQQDFLVRAWKGCLGGGMYNGARFSLPCVSWDDTAVWHHVVLVIDGGTLALYFDGAPGREVAYEGSVAVRGYPFTIGTFGVADDTRTWNGAIDEVWLAPIARSPAWIAALHASQSGEPFYELSVVAEW